VADLKRDILIQPKNPRPWKNRYLLLRRVSDDPYQRTADRTFHGVEGGCFAARGDHNPENYAFTEAMIYVDGDSTYWIPDPGAVTNQLNGWRTIEPCKVCGFSELDNIISERLLWQHRGRCYRTYHPGFFATEDGVGIGGKHKQERVAALQLCNGDKEKGFAPCPVLKKCRDWGLCVHALQAVVGILGGIDEVERRKLLRAPRSPQA